MLSWLSDWCNPACQFADLDEAGVDMRMKTRDEPGPRYDGLRAHAGAEDYELVRDHEDKRKRIEYVAAGGVLPVNTGGVISASVLGNDGQVFRADTGYIAPYVAPIRAGKTRPRWFGWVDELNPPAPKPLPRIRRPLFAGLLRRLWP